jgi:hypothetical protein
VVVIRLATDRQSSERRSEWYKENCLYIEYQKDATRDDSDKILICRQEYQRMTDAQLGEQGVDGANLQARTRASVAQFSGINVVLSIWIEKW